MDYTSLGLFLGWLIAHQWILALLVIWSLAWKGLALWRAGRNNHPVWFVAILLINTAGILEILYLLFFSKKLKD